MYILQNDIAVSVSLGKSKVEKTFSHVVFPAACCQKNNTLIPERYWQPAGRSGPLDFACSPRVCVGFLQAPQSKDTKLRLIGDFKLPVAVVCPRVSAQ